MHQEKNHVTSLLNQRYIRLTGILVLIFIFTFYLLSKQERAPEKGIFAFTNVNIISMKNGTPEPNRTIVISGDIITAITEAQDATIPGSAIKIDCTGKYLIPGLIDMHVHLRKYTHYDPLKLCVAMGITTVRSFDDLRSSQNRKPFVLRLKEDIITGTKIGPRIYTAGPIINGMIARAWKSHIAVSSPEEARAAVTSQARQGYDFIKIYTHLPQREFKAAMEEARRNNMYTAGHIPYSMGLDAAIKEGMREIAHINELKGELIDDLDRSINKPDHMLPDQLSSHHLHEKNISAIVLKIIKSQTIVCSTLIVDELKKEIVTSPHTFISRPLARYCSPADLDAIQRGRDWRQVLYKDRKEYLSVQTKLYKKILRSLHDKGAIIVAGTDSMYGPVVHGFSLHDELKIFTQNGFTPYEALKAATATAAQVCKYMGIQEKFGTIEVNNRADLVLLEKNPLIDIDNLKAINGVMVDGRWYDLKKIKDFLEKDKHGIMNRIIDSYHNMLFFLKKQFRRQ